jgi:hypothetical protein
MVPALADVGLSLPFATVSATSLDNSSGCLSVVPLCEQPARRCRLALGPLSMEGGQQLAVL